MTTITIEEELNIPTNYKTFEDFLESYSKSNYPESNIKNRYKTAWDMKEKNLPNDFISNFLKSYE